MANLTDDLAAKLDRCVIENFADIYLLDAALKTIENKHDLDKPDVIAAIATCADVASAQARLTARPPAALAKGLTAALERGLRPTSELLVRALLDGALLEAGQPATPAVPRLKGAPKPLPAFARPARLPAPLDAKGKRATLAEVEALVREIAAAKPGDPPESAYTPESLARLGRALVLGWLSHGAEPKLAWAAHAAGHFPDDATARDLGMMAREIGPRVGQFSKAQILVDVLAAMNTRAALEALHQLATKVKTRSVKDRAQLAFDAAAKRSGITEHDLADKLIADDAPVGKDFVKRLEQRMVEVAKMSAVELIENIVQRDAVRARARGVVFGAQIRSRLVTFTIADDADGARLVDLEGEDFALPAKANVVVVHPLDLPPGELERWREKISGAPFAQLDRAVQRFSSLRALTKHVKQLVGTHCTQGAVYRLGSFGWRRGDVGGGQLRTLTRELDELAATLEISPGVYLGRGLPAATQTIASIAVRGTGSPRAMGELALELATLTR
ncbi:MAG TPA: DUF4132 domain-containing protein [Kofleriaceae bacterium]